VNREWGLYWDCVWHKVYCLAEGYTNTRYQVTLAWCPMFGVPQCGTCLLSLLATRIWRWLLDFLKKVCSADLSVQPPHFHDVTEIDKEWKAVRQKQQTYIDVISVLTKPFLYSRLSPNVYLCRVILLSTMRMTSNYINQQMHNTTVQYTMPPDKKHTNTHHID
jgi:hypothetical protein